MAVEDARAIYSIARGSSDATANILSYEFMRELGIPVTSLPPSVYSVGNGVSMKDALGLVISQSGASEDLVRAARGVGANGGRVAAITNVASSAVEGEAEVTLSIGAGEEKAVPATKTVIGSIAAGLALLAAIKPAYASKLNDTIAKFESIGNLPSNDHASLKAALLRARHVYVVGRDTGFGAAHEVALRSKRPVQSMPRHTRHPRFCTVPCNSQQTHSRFWCSTPVRLVLRNASKMQLLGLRKQALRFTASQPSKDCCPPPLLPRSYAIFTQSFWMLHWN